MNDDPAPASRLAQASRQNDLPATVYTAQSPMRQPRKLVQDMLRDVKDSRELAWRLFLRDVKAQHRKSALGYAWFFIPPLFASLPFIYLDSAGVVNMGETPIPYGAYAMIGTIIWQVFVDALNSPLRSMSSARNMLQRINFPREAILLSGLMQVGFGFLVRLVLLTGIFLWFALVPPPTFFLFFAGILSLVLLGFVVGLLITPVGLLYGDVQSGLPIATSFLMLLTPVLYPVPKSGVAAIIANLNPLTPLVVTTRDWMTTGSTTHLIGFVLVSGLAGVFLVLGWIALRVGMPHLIARMGN